MTRSIVASRTLWNDGRPLPYRESGLALAGVLWAVLILSMIAAVIVGLSRSSNAIVDNHIRHAQSEALLEAGIKRLILGLLDLRSPWRIDGTPYEFTFSGEIFQLSALYERGKFDLNHSPEESLKALFITGGASLSHAGLLARAIMLQRTLNGQTGQLFHSIVGVRSLPGMTDELYCRVASALTVYSQQSEPDERVASELVLAALADIHVVQRARLSDILSENSAISGIDLAGQAVTLRAELISASRLRKGLPPLTKEVVIRFTGNLRQPVWQLAAHDSLKMGFACTQQTSFATSKDTKTPVVQKK